MAEDLVKLVTAPYNAEADFLAHRLVVLDGTDWGGAMEAVQAGLIPKTRKFKAPFIEGDVAPEVEAAIDAIAAIGQRLYSEMFPTFRHTDRVARSFRPMITGPEPMHYDSYGGANPLVTAYINISPEPRHYRIGNNFPGLLKQHGDHIRKLAGGRNDITYELRVETANGHGPLGPLAPRHEVFLAPGAIWFFNAKTVAHEVVYGTGTIGLSWEVPECGAKLPPQLIEESRKK